MPGKPREEAQRRFVPLHAKISEKLRKKILSGKHGVGEHLPTETELCEVYKTSRVTIRHALRSLTDAGYIRRSPRRGTVVVSNRPDAHPPWMMDTLADIVALGEHATLEVLSYKEERVSKKDADLLGAATAFRMQAIRNVKGKAIAYTSILLPSDIGSRLIREDFRLNTVFVLLDRMGCTIGSVSERIAACPAGRLVARVLACSEDTPMLFTERHYKDVDEKTIEIARSWYLHDQFSIQRQIPIRR